MRFDLDALSSPSSFQQIPLDAIDEDPEQPRKEFDPAALRELADTIAERGVLQPVSVRCHPKQPARFILNFGARRLRASRLASKAAIPAFIDELASSYDQVIENEQREGLTPLELALFVERRLAAGDSQAEIARRLGKSRPYVTYATALIAAPDWLLTLYRNGRCRGLLELHELRQLQLRCPDAVRTLESDTDPVTRQRLAALKAAHADGRAGHQRRVAEHGTAGINSLTDRSSQIRIADSRRRVSCRQDNASPSTDLTYALLAELDGRIVEVMVDCVPSEDGFVFVKDQGQDSQGPVAAGALKLIRLAARVAR